MSRSSGEDSDNSHSSRGSLGQTSSTGSAAEDLNIIERTMARVLSLLHKWILETGEMPDGTSFSDAVVLLFFDQVRRDETEKV